MNGNHKKHCKGFVYSMTNDADNNEIVALRRGFKGRLSFINSFSTGGEGSGEPIVDPLTSQGSVILSRRARYLFAVNNGSDSISSFRISPYGGLSLVDVEPSGGVAPNSLAQYRDLLFVTNEGDAGNDSNVTGFRIANDGSLTFIGSFPLSTPDAQPSCVVFSPNGRLLVVSERTTNILSVYLVNGDGTLNGPVANPSNGASPFGEVFLRKGFLLVAEAGPNALSSYTADTNGNLDVISGSVINGQVATCWVAVTRRERFAYTANAGNGGTITRYRINNDGTLFVKETVFSTLFGTGAPLDTAVSRDGRNLYSLNGNQGSISVFKIGRYGRLFRVEVFEPTGLPEIGAQGLAVI
ncbi:MAG: lactonase family protein [Syntrophomonadaceae bacterium]|nr:lactonase family protein [Syntrophomonadaceae bacterium]